MIAPTTAEVLWIPVQRAIEWALEVEAARLPADEKAQVLDEFHDMLTRLADNCFQQRLEQLNQSMAAACKREVSGS